MALKRKSILALFSVLLCLTILLIFPQNARANIEPFDITTYDPSTIPMNNYDTYTKDTDPSFKCPQPLVSHVNRPGASEFAKSAWLRKPSEKHYYGLIKTQPGKLPRNALTVIADPEVKFTVNVAKETVFDSKENTGNHSFYNNIQLYGRDVYYVEFPYTQLGDPSNYMYIEFFTDSPEPVYYTMWFGGPVMCQSRQSTDVFYSATPTAASTETQINQLGNGHPRAWGYRVYLQADQPDIYKMNYKYYTWELWAPGNPIVGYSKKYHKDNWSEGLTQGLNDIYAYPLAGTYKSRITDLKWSSNSGYFIMTGKLCVEYYYALGAGSTPVYS